MLVRHGKQIGLCRPHVIVDRQQRNPVPLHAFGQSMEAPPRGAQSHARQKQVVNPAESSNRSLAYGA
jgi:hypothetical protein